MDLSVIIPVYNEEKNIPALFTRLESVFIPMGISYEYVFVNDGSKDKLMKLLQNLFKNGLIAFSCGHNPYKVRFLLPAILESKHIVEIRGILKKTLIETSGV